MKKLKVKPSDMDKLPKWSVGYGPKLRVQVPYPENPREGQCDACGRSISKKEINVTHLHHWLYKYQHNTLKKNPLLTLENLNELCFTGHKIADGFRGILCPNRNPIKDSELWRLVKVAGLMPKDLKKKMDWFARAWLDFRKRDREKTMHDYA